MQAEIPAQVIHGKFLTNLVMVMPQRLEPTGLPALRHLTVHVKRRSSGLIPLPTLDSLRSLDLYLTGPSTALLGDKNTPLINFDRFKNLLSLLVEGDTWSGFGDIFGGSATKLMVCILRGPLIVIPALRHFFDRLASCLRYLYIEGAHLVGRIETTFPQLRHLSLHRVFSSNNHFTFVHCPVLRSLAIVGDNFHAMSRVEDLNALLQGAILHVANTLQFLTLRSGLCWILSPVAIHAVQRAVHLRGLLLDGSVMLDGRDWLLVLRASELTFIVRTESWLPISVSWFHPFPNTRSKPLLILS